MASPNYIIFFPPFPKNKPQNNFEWRKSSAFQQGRALRRSTERRPRRVEVPHALCSTYGTWEHPLLGDLAPGCAGAAASPLIGCSLDPLGLGRSVPQVLMGGRPGLPGVLPVLVGLHKFTALRRGTARPVRSLLQVLPALNPKFYSFSEGTGRSKVPNKHTCPRSSSLIVSALGAAQTSNTSNCTQHVQLVQLHTPLWAQVCLCQPSAALQAHPWTLSSQAKASHRRDTARKGSATLLLLQRGGTALMPCTHSGGPELHVWLLCSAS